MHNEFDEYKVDKWSTICMKGSHYSVPDTLVGKMVTVKVYSEKLVVLHDNQKVAVHERIYSQKGWSVKLEHYLTTLARKPGAVGDSLALRQMPRKIQDLFDNHFTDNARDFVLLLQYAADHGFTHDDIAAAHEALISRGLRKVSADQIKAMMHAGDEEQAVCETLQHKPDMIEDGAMRILLDLSRMMENQRNTIN